MAAALVTTLLLGTALPGCATKTSTPHPVAQTVITWHTKFVSDNAHSCDVVTPHGQEELAIYASTADCSSAASKLLRAFTMDDREGFLHVRVAANRIQVTGNQALVPAGAITYTPQPAETVALNGPIILVRTDEGWLLDSVVYVPEH